MGGMVKPDPARCERITFNSNLEKGLSRALSYPCSEKILKGLDVGLCWVQELLLEREIAEDSLVSVPRDYHQQSPLLWMT
jgi:hypothetical protein